MSNKNRKNTTSKSKQSLLAAGLALIVADQVPAAFGKNSGVAAKGQVTPPPVRQIPAAEDQQADVQVKNLIAQADDGAIAVRVSATEQAAPGDFLMASAEAADLRKIAELGIELTDVQLAEIAPQGNELLLAQAAIAPGAVEAAASGAEVSTSASATAAAAAGAISPLAIFGAVAGVGLVAGASGGSAPVPVPALAPAGSGVVVDGYLVGSTVSRVDGTGNTVLTDANGGFVGLTGTGAIKVSGGIDKSTGQPFTGVLFAPAGSGAITPLTTLVNSLVNSGMSAEDAKAAVLAKLGLPANYDLLNADPFAQAAAGDLNAFAVLKAGSAIATLLQTLGGGDPVNFGNIANALAKLLSSSATLDLSNPAALVSGLTAQMEADGITFSSLSTDDLSALINGLTLIATSSSVTNMAMAQAGTLENTLGLEAYKPLDTAAKISQSLVTLAAMESNPIVGAAGDSFLIEGGLGAIGTDTLDSLGLSFGQDLDVTLDLLAADATTDAILDGTIQLNTSLAGLAGLGIDHITSDAGQNVTITGGLGAIGSDTLDSLGLSFGQDLDVTLDLLAADATTDAIDDGTIQLNTSLAGLAGLGIDHITGDAEQDVFISGGFGNFTSAHLATLAAGGFANNLDVTLGGLSSSDLTNYSASISGMAGWSGATTDLVAIGVDIISVGTDDVSLDDIAALISSGLDFAAADNISLIDADIEGTLMAGGGISLDDLADLGIDTVDADTGAAGNIKLAAGDTVTDEMSSSDLESALADILAKFDGAVFAEQDNVSLDIGNNAVAVADLSAGLLEGIVLLGIDTFSNGEVELWNKNSSA